MEIPYCQQEAWKILTFGTLHKKKRGITMTMLQIIKKLLRERGKTQSDLCKHLGLNKQAFTDWNAGRTNSYVKYLPQIAEFLEVPVNSLYGELEFPVEIPTVSVKDGRVRVALKEPSEHEILKLYRSSSPEARAFARQILAKSVEVETPVAAKVQDRPVSPIVGVKRAPVRGEARNKTRGRVRVRLRKGRKEVK